MRYHIVFIGGGMKKNRAELVATFIIGYVALLAICLVIYFIFTKAVGLQIFGNISDQSTVLTNLFIWSATLYSPIIIFTLADQWKKEKSYDEIKIIFDEIYENLSESYYKMLLLNVRITDIYNNGECSFENKKNIENFEFEYNIKTFVKIYSLLDRYKVIKNDDSIYLKFREYESLYMRLDSNNSHLIKYLKTDNKIHFKTTYEKSYKTIYDSRKTETPQIIKELNYPEANKDLEIVYDELMRLINKKLKIS